MPYPKSVKPVPKKPEKKPRGCVDCGHRGTPTHAWCPIQNHHVPRKAQVCDEFFWKRGAK